MRVIDLKRQRFGRLKVVSRAKNNRWGQARWNCVCDCGTKITTNANSLRLGVSKSCGCRNKGPTAEKYRTHGMSTTRTYYIWNGIMQRCYNKNRVAYPNYGGRGIRVCDRWRHSFKNFYEDIGPIEEPLTIDRINNDGDYTPDNTRLITKYEQLRNTRRNLYITHPKTGETMCAADWSRRLEGCLLLVAGRIFHGWTPEEAITTPVGEKRASKR